MSMHGVEGLAEVFVGQLTEKREMQASRQSIDRPVCRSLQHKLLWWVVALVISSTVLSTYWLNRIATGSIRDSHVRNAVIISQTLAGSLAERMGPEDRHKAVNLISRMQPDRRMAFVALLDEHGTVVHNDTRNFEAWSQYQQWLDNVHHRSRVRKPIVLGEFGELVVYKTPIWNPPPGVGSSRGSRSLEGYVVLAMHEEQLGQMIHHLWLLQVAAAAAICLITVPIVVWGAKKWTAPLRELLAATSKLSSGQEPQPIDATSNDELGVLAESFNGMAIKLYATQKALEKSNQQLEQSNQQLEESNEQLEHKVRLRTAELENLNHRLESELRDKDEFLRTVTHDLSTPLRNISGMAMMILKKNQSDLNDDTINKLNRITANVKVQAELIDDLMELSRLRTRPAKQELVNLHELAEKLVWSLAYDLECQHIELEIIDPLPTITTDRLRIRQVLQNLLDNAIKYMGNSEKRQITMGYKLVDNVPQFSVADTGGGIDPWDLPTIFNVFRRGVYSKATKETTGRGVGLSSVKAIVETMGGRVWVESPPGEGATFYFTLDQKCLQSSTHAAA